MTDGHTDRGKWSQANVPHRGWRCVGSEDLGQPSQLCEMCEGAEIRYVHVMEHDDYSRTLEVGCVCAEHMEQDYKAPKRREQKLRSRAMARRNWGRKTWRISAAGNSYLNIQGFNLAVFQKLDDPLGPSWAIRVTHRATGQDQFGRRRYLSEGDAKRAAFDALAWAKDNLGPS